MATPVVSRQYVPPQRVDQAPNRFDGGKESFDQVLIPEDYEEGVSDDDDQGPVYEKIGEEEPKY